MATSFLVAWSSCILALVCLLILAQIKAWMRSVFNKRNDIHNLRLSRVSHQAQNKPPPFDPGQTSEATDSVESPESYLNRATKCMEGVKKVRIGGVFTEVKLNRNQCKYLVEKLETTVASSKNSFNRSSSPEHKAECLETLKLLYQVSTEVEGFIQDCCEDTWVQSSLLWEEIPARVTLLGYYLDLCTELLRNNNRLGSAFLVCTKLEGLSQVEFQSVTKRALLDRGTLIESLIALSWKFWIKESQLAKIILARLFSKDPLSLPLSLALSLPLSLLLSQSDFLIARTSIKLEKLLGKGSSGSVHKGIWMETEVAVRSKGASSLRVEKDVLESLSHPNIVTVLGYCQDTGEEDTSIVLELMDEDLLSLINRRNSSHNDGEEMKTPFTIAEAVDLMLQVAEGVNYLHQNRIFHGDLKSNHILVKHIKGKETKISAKVADNWFMRKLKQEYTRTYLFFDDPMSRWSAPEELTEDRFVMKVLSSKSDVYSFAMLCYEILTGDIPFSNISSLVGVRRRVLEGDRPMLPAQCPEDLKSLIEICWASKAKQRPSFRKICEELRYLKCSILLGPFSQIQIHHQDQPIAILNLPGLSHLKIELSCLNRQMQLGKGGSETTVYSTYWRSPDVVQDLVAQKRFIGANNEQFKKEITILAGLKHSNVVGMLGYATDTRSCSIIMEKMDGDLRDLIHQRRFQGHSIPTGLFAMDEAIYIMREIARGMHYIHLENVAHRDLKTCNILVRNNGLSVKDLVVKVADFGVSEKKSQVGNFENVSYNIGTLRWMAPEVMKLKNEEDTHVDSSNYDLLKCDVYSFAMVCFEILTGDVPFAHINLEGLHENQALKKAVLVGERPRLPECPSKLKTLIERCWNGDARVRPSFGEICIELQGLL